MKKISGGKAVVKTLEACGVEMIFGIPGIHNLDIYEALLDSSIRHVTARHEQGAGFMADGYARSSCKVGIALVISGPGLTNILTSMGEAFHESIPMIVISSQIATQYHGSTSGTLHELSNSTTMVRSVAKESRTVTAVEQIPIYIVEAFRLATTGRPGPVHVEIPLDILKQEIKEPSNEEVESLIKSVKIREYPVQTELLEQAAVVLKKAKQPLIIVGRGACEAGGIVTKLAEHLGSVTILTTAAKGTISEDHPLCLGVRQHFPSVRDYVMSADAVLAVGTVFSEDFYGNSIQVKGTLIRIDTNPYNYEGNLSPDINILGDIYQSVNTLIEKIPVKTSGSFSTSKVARLIEEAAEERPAVFGYKDLSLMLEMLNALREVLPVDGILCSDATGPGVVGYSEYIVFQPRTYIFPYGYGTLGMGLPAGIGAKIANPDKAVCVLAGDGGFQFTMEELGVACQEKLCIPIIIWDNAGFGEIRLFQEMLHPGKRIAVDHLNPDFVRLASVYGIPGKQVHDGKEMKSALKNALAHRGPSIIVVKSF